jgi:hypothetical protein
MKVQTTSAKKTCGSEIKANKANFKDKWPLFFCKQANEED